MARASWATMNGGERIVDVEDARLALGALWTPGSSAVNARAGIRVAGGNPGRVSASSPTPDGKVHVKAFQGVLAASRGVGNYGTTLDADKTIDVLTATPADPSNDRIDLVAEVQTDTFYGDASTAYEVKLIVGDPAAAPVDPIDKIASPDYRILARVRIPAGSTALDDSDIDNVDQPWTVAAGGVLPVRNLAERDAIIDPHDGQAIYRYDRDWIETWTGVAWRVQGVAVCSSASDRNSAITNPYSGQLAITTDTDTEWQYDGSSAAWVRFGGAPMPRGLVARGRRTTASASTTGIVGVLRIGDSGTIPVVVGRAYRVSAVVHPRSTVAGDRIVSEIRYTTDGSEPTNASPALAQKYSTAIAPDSAETDPFEITYEPGSSHNLRLLLTVSRGVGSGVVQMYADATASTELVVEDIGLAVGDTGVDI